MKTIESSLTLINRNQSTCLISVIVPTYNEQEVLPLLHSRLVVVLEMIDPNWEIIYIDDGSNDGTSQLLHQLQSNEPRAGWIKLSRNFGKEAAMSAGFRVACGAAVIVIDADLQDPPELIIDMVCAWRKGADIVNMRRRRREGETWFKKVTASAFYRIINYLSEVPLQENVGDFRLLNRRAVNAINQLPETNRFMKGLFTWIGYSQVTLEYDRHARAAGHTKWHYWKLWNFALEGITSFSTMPLKLATYIGFITAVGAFLYALYFLIKTLLVGDEVHGFPTLIVTLLFLGGLQLMASGILGEYIGRLFMESKRRPLFLLDEYQPTQSYNNKKGKKHG